VPDDLAFFRGRLQLDAGQPAAAEQSFSRYLAGHPSQVKALILRAEARLELRQPMAAADDYSHAILLSESPSPELYRNNALSLVAAGEPQWPAARVVTDSGLSRFALEVSLLGLAVDIALAQDDLEGARLYFSRVPEAIRSLPRWASRSKLLAQFAADKPSERAAALNKAREELLARRLQLH
jgi:Tfp pilus assembly protein PilF